MTHKQSNLQVKQFGLKLLAHNLNCKDIPTLTLTDFLHQMKIGELFTFGIVKISSF